MTELNKRKPLSYCQILDVVLNLEGKILCTYEMIFGRPAFLGYIFNYMIQNNKNRFAGTLIVDISNDYGTGAPILSE